MSGCRIFIGRLSPSAREKDVERFFKGYGRIRDIDLKRGFGFVVSSIMQNNCVFSLDYGQDSLAEPEFPVRFPIGQILTTNARFQLRRLTLLPWKSIPF